ncbi:YihY/virulence factor BrkB family protein [Streptosporangium lutulentum]
MLADSHRQAGHTGGAVALWLGLITALVSLTSAMAQVERGANRIYGVERDRPFHRKYGRALLMALSAGAFMTVGFTVMVGGGAIGRALAQVYEWGDGAMEAYNLVRWPLGFLLALLSASVLFRAAPRRRQPGHTWLAFGALVSIALWTVFTLLLAFYIESSGTFGATYGPLTAVMALLLWSFLSSIALFLGLAFAAQLEACRGGSAGPVTPDPGPTAEEEREPLVGAAGTAVITAVRKLPVAAAGTAIVSAARRLPDLLRRYRARGASLRPPDGGTTCDSPTGEPTKAVRPLATVNSCPYAAPNHSEIYSYAVNQG